MRLIRSLLALALLVAGNWLLDRADAVRVTKTSEATAVGMHRQSDLRPVELMLLGSIVGLAICTLWIWISARAAA